MAYATVEDVAVRMGVPPESLNQDQVQAVLDDTSALVTAFTGVDFSVDPYPPVPQSIVWATCSRTIRVLNNPDGLRQETIGNYSYSLGTDSEALNGGWTDAEVAILNSFGWVIVARKIGQFWVGYTDTSPTYPAVATADRPALP
jgi:hypothetical protein